MTHPLAPDGGYYVLGGLYEFKADRHGQGRLAFTVPKTEYAEASKIANHTEELLHIIIIPDADYQRLKGLQHSQTSKTGL